MEEEFEVEVLDDTPEELTTETFEEGEEVDFDSLNDQAVVIDQPKTKVS